MIIQNIFRLITLLQSDFSPPLLSSVMSFQDFSNIQLFVFSLFFVGICYVLNRIAWLSVQRGNRSVFPGDSFSKGGSRLIIFLGHALSIAVIIMIFWQLMIWDSINLQVLFYALLVYGACAFLLAHFYNNWLIGVAEKTGVLALKRSSLQIEQAERNMLKAELNPHFLFNSINVLSQLLRQDKNKSSEFAANLALVYQYFDQHSQREVVALKDELTFLEHYGYLLKIRYSGAFFLNINLSPQDRDLAILPCTLQLLVENCMKHNVLSEEEPLEITIRRTGEWLVVENPYRPVPQCLPTTGKGLKNIKARYRHFIQKEIRVALANNRFVVYIPLSKQVPT
jgi:two-component system LytT family sensor kinase